jgi:gamma-glutamylcyclotransferase (GGCT)/AIG2-like uncharacterized protein YtfP
MKSRRTYLAFGSNLDTAQMARRCPNARLLGSVKLTGYRLAFVGHSKRWDGAVATLVRDAKASVPALLYELNAADERRLDAFEGYPGVYGKRTVQVLGRGAQGRSAFLYVLPGRQAAEPALDYLLLIARAYRELGFDMRPLIQAAKRKA